jgi:hypothetical protein
VKLPALLAAVLCAACSPTLVTRDAPSGFDFEGDFRLDTTIDGATLGSASYTGGQTIHVALTFASYAGSQGSGASIEVEAHGETSMFIAGPFCELQGCSGAGTPYREIEQAVVIWNLGSNAPVIQDQGTCETTAGSCAWSN